MKHAHPSYDRIQDPDHKIPHDEPVFLLRAGELFGAPGLKAYLHLISRSGEVAPEYIAVVSEHVKAFEAWPNKRIPDLPREVVKTRQSGFRA